VPHVHFESKRQDGKKLAASTPYPLRSRPSEIT